MKTGSDWDVNGSVLGQIHIATGIVKGKVILVPESVLSQNWELCFGTGFRRELVSVRGKKGGGRGRESKTLKP